MKSDRKKKIENSRIIDTKPQLPGVDETGRAVAKQNHNVLEYLKKAPRTFKNKESITESLKKKSKKSGIPLKVVVEVFRRGVLSWNESSKIDKIQTGFNRVNSFIAEGLARKLDAQLLEVKKPQKKQTKEASIIKKVRGICLK
jgi:hypothetical protein